MFLGTYSFFQVVKFVVFYCLYLCAISPISFLNLFISVLSFFLNVSKGLSILTFQKTVYFYFFGLYFIYFFCSLYYFLAFIFFVSVFIFLIRLCGRLFFVSFFFFQICFSKQTYKLSSQNCFYCTLQILKSYAFIFIYLKYILISSLIFSLAHLIFQQYFFILHLFLFLPFSPTN